MKWAIIDDIRELNCDLIAKTGEKGIAMMADNILDIECLCLDHDLGDEKAMNGYDVLKVLFDRHLAPNHVQLVTSNPVGRYNMESLLIANNYKTIDGRNFFAHE